MRLFSTTNRPLQSRGDHGSVKETRIMKHNLLLIGRWHGITRDQRNALRRGIDECGAGKLVFIITAADQKNTRRHPLSIAERCEVVSCLAEELGREFEIYAVNDISDSTKWVEHICEAVREQSKGNTVLDSGNTILVSANPEVQKWFEAISFPSHSAQFDGAMPSDMLHAIRSRKNWRKLATHSTFRLFNKFGVEKRVRDLFGEVLVTDDGELSTGRDFGVYGSGMDASAKQKFDDILPYVLAGLIGDMGCGTGILMEYLSERFPSSEIVGVDLSREFQRIAESRHYPHHNVSVVKGNIVAVPFANGVVSTLIYSSVVHEIRSYNGYSTELVRETLRRSRRRLRVGGRIIIRDGIKPAPQKVWMRCDAETEERFRRFAVDFKKSPPTREFVSKSVNWRDRNGSSSACTTRASSCRRKTISRIGILRSTKSSERSHWKSGKRNSRLPDIAWSRPAHI